MCWVRRRNTAIVFSHPTQPTDSTQSLPNPNDMVCRNRNTHPKNHLEGPRIAKPPGKRTKRKALHPLILKTSYSNRKMRYWHRDRKHEVQENREPRNQPSRGVRWFLARALRPSNAERWFFPANGAGKTRYPHEKG